MLETYWGVIVLFAGAHFVFFDNIPSTLGAATFTAEVTTGSIGGKRDVEVADEIVGSDMVLSTGVSGSNGATGASGSEEAAGVVLPWS